MHHDMCHSTSNPLLTHVSLMPSHVPGASGFSSTLKADKAGHGNAGLAAATTQAWKHHLRVPGVPPTWSRGTAGVKLIGTTYVLQI